MDCWQMEKRAVSVPLSEMILMQKKDWLKEQINGNFNYTCLLKI